MGGGSKVFAEKAPSNGRHICVTSTPGRMVTHPAAEFLGRRFESWSVDAGRGAAAVLATGFEPPTKKFCSCLHYHSATANPETNCFPHCLDPCLPLTKNPKCVFLSD